MLLVAGMMVREFILYVQKRQTYSRRRWTIRMCMALMLLFLLASILVGVNVFHLGSPEENGYVQLWAAFWGSVMLIVAGIFCLAIVDLRTISVESHHDTSILWREMAETIAAHELKRREK